MDETLLALPERERFSGCTANGDGQSENKNGSDKYTF
jgi:hypothetical protein